MERNGIRYKKAELAEKVVAKLNGPADYEEEFREQFVGIMERITGLTSASTGRS